MWSLDPSDVLNVKIADYGISRFANPSGVKGQEGTPGYVAPEALRRRGEDQAFDEKVTFCGSLFVGMRTSKKLIVLHTHTQQLTFCA